MGRGIVCQFYGCNRTIDPKDRMGTQFGLCPRHARNAEQRLGITPTKGK